MTQTMAEGGSEQSMVAKSRRADLLQLCSGGVAGALGKTCTAPLSRLTVLMQLRGMTTHPLPSSSSVLSSLHHRHTAASLNAGGGLLHEARRVALEEGIRGFWKGNFVAVLHRIPYSSITFFSYEKYKKALMEWSSSSKSTAPPEEEEAAAAFTPPQRISHKILAGEAAPFTAVCVTYPLDLVKTRLAAQTTEAYYKGIPTEAYYKGILHALLKIPRDEVLLSLYKGMGATLLSVAPNVAINFGVYEMLKARLLLSHPTPSSPASDHHHHHHQKSSTLWSLGLGRASALVSSTFTFPLHVIRRRKQLEGAAQSDAVVCQKRSSLAMIVHIAKREGLFRGIPKDRTFCCDYLHCIRTSQGHIQRCLIEWVPWIPPMHPAPFFSGLPHCGDSIYT